MSISTAAMRTCSYFPSCTGCNSWNTSYEKQAHDKVAHLKNLLFFEQVDFVSKGTSELRNRVDFTIQNADKKMMGFYDQNKSLIDIAECLQLSPDLQKVYTEFRQIPFSIRKGSVRLRVGPDKQKGCWLDFANLDIKNLLDAGTTLKKLLQLNYHIEVGQKGKTVKLKNEKLALTEPEPKNWFSTLDKNLNILPLQCLISGFTQPSWLTAQEIAKLMLQWIQDKNLKTALEFGSGIGQFTIPLLSAGMNVDVFESDLQLLDYLKINAEQLSLKENQLKIHHGDFQNKSAFFREAAFDLALVNPPRSGLKKFSQEVIRAKAKYCIYISCFPETMAHDISVFKQAGYKISKVALVDQFPQTHHYESCVLLEKTI